MNKIEIIKNFKNYLKTEEQIENPTIIIRKERQVSVENFLEKAKKVRNDIDNYDWSNIDLSIRDHKGRVLLKCKEHGYFPIRMDHFLNGVIGCKSCNGRKKDYKKIKKQLQEIHPNLDFSNSVFKGLDDDYSVTYVCPIHGEKKARLYNLLHGEGCWECAMKQNGLNQMMTKDEFLERSSKNHDLTKYNFDKTDLKNRDAEGKVTITCLKHGDFKILPSNFMKGVGCSKCANELRGEKQKLKQDEILNKCNKLYGDKYTFLDLEKYDGAKKPLTIKCNDCGNIFSTTICSLLSQKCGCPVCNQTSLEQLIACMLKENNIPYIYRAKKKDIPWIKRLELDFYIPEYNIAIECQGGQHFFPVKLWGGEDNYKKIVARDKIKKLLCEEHNIDLLYFSTDKINDAPYQVYTNTEDILNIIKSKEKKS